MLPRSLPGEPAGSNRPVDVPAAGPLGGGPDNIEPNLENELERCARGMNLRLSFRREARDMFLTFATSREARWTGDFRDFNAAIRRMATLCSGGRIGVEEITEKLARLRSAWGSLHRRLADGGGPRGDLERVGTFSARSGRPNSIISTAYSSTRCSASARTRPPPRRPDGGCSRSLALERRRPTTPTASGSTSPDSASSGAIFVASEHVPVLGSGLDRRGTSGPITFVGRPAMNGFDTTIRRLR